MKSFVYLPQIKNMIKQLIKHPASIAFAFLGLMVIVSIILAKVIN
jgi:hypothetical protein